MTKAEIYRLGKAVAQQGELLHTAIGWLYQLENPASDISHAKIEALEKGHQDASPNPKEQS